jgi:hypothetical protein
LPEEATGMDAAAAILLNGLDKVLDTEGLLFVFNNAVSVPPDNPKTQKTQIKTEYFFIALNSFYLF